MKPFNYMKPERIEEVFSTLTKDADAYILAGGTDLLTKIKNNVVKPKTIVDIKSLSALKSISESGDFWRIGSLVTIREIEVSRILREKIPFLCQAASSLGSVQIRNRGTVGGNLCNASPAADMATMLMAMDAHVKIASSGNEKDVSLEQFFTGPNSTVLEEGEILTEIIVPKSMERFKGIYMKFGPRKAMDIGIVSAAILIDINEGSSECGGIRISLGAVAPTPIRARNAEALLTGKLLEPKLIDNAGEVASEETRPITDFRASADYRKNLVRVMVARGIKKLVEGRE